MSLRGNKLYSFNLYHQIKLIDLGAAEYFWGRVITEKKWGTPLGGVFVWHKTPQGPAFWITADQLVTPSLKKEDPWSNL